MQYVASSQQQELMNSIKGFIQDGKVKYSQDKK